MNCNLEKRKTFLTNKQHNQAICLKENLLRRKKQCLKPKHVVLTDAEKQQKSVGEKGLGMGYAYTKKGQSDLPYNRKRSKENENPSGR